MARTYSPVTGPRSDRLGRRSGTLMSRRLSDKGVRASLTADPHVLVGVAGPVGRCAASSRIADPDKDVRASLTADPHVLVGVAGFEPTASTSRT